MPAALLGNRPKSCPVSKQHVVRRATLDKWDRSLSTPTGQKLFRIQPSINNDSISKYQNREGSGSESDRHSSHGRSTPPVSRPQTAGCFPISSTPRSGSTSDGRPKTPYVVHRHNQSPSSEGSSSDGRRQRGSVEKFERPNTAHSLTYSTRSSACTPPNLYNQDKLREAMREKQPSGHARKCEFASRNQPKREDKIPRRFGKPIHLPGYVKGNEFLTHDELSLGQKQYIWGIAQVYSVTDLKVLKQRQYQSLLDYEFSRRLQNKELSERKRIREMKEYMKYTRFIQTYEQRIPRLLRSQGEVHSPCRELRHIHKHSLTGWTTQSPSQQHNTSSSSSEYKSEESVQTTGEDSEQEKDSSCPDLEQDKSSVKTDAENEETTKSASNDEEKEPKERTNSDSKDEEQEDEVKISLSDDGDVSGTLPENNNTDNTSPDNFL